MWDLAEWKEVAISASGNRCEKVTPCETMKGLKMRSPHLLPSSPLLHCCPLAGAQTSRASSRHRAFACSAPSGPGSRMASFLSVSIQMFPSEKPSLTTACKTAASYHHIRPFTLLIFCIVTITKDTIYCVCFLPSVYPDFSASSTKARTLFCSLLYQACGPGSAFTE